MADEIGISLTSYKKYESGEVCLQWKTL
nr:hypothetical protein [Vibrio cholerae]